MSMMEQVYQAYFLDVYRFALRLCGDSQLAQDITSATFLKAMDGLKGFKGQSELRVWLCSIARNHYYSYLRRQGREVVVDSLPEQPDPVPGPEQALLDKEEGTQALQAALALPEPGRQVFLLRALSGQPFAQIGRIFGRSENWACVVYHRARQKLKTLMGDNDEH